MENTLSHSQRKFVRSEKNRIRGLVSDIKKQDEMIGEVYKKLAPKVKEASVKTETPAAKVEAKKEAPKKEAKKAKVVKTKK